MSLKIAIFSKHLEFLEGEALAAGAKEIGFDGIDLAVRAKGHIEPARVKQDLPALVALIRKQGLEVPMLTTDIVDASTPFAEDILAVMADLGIHHYRWGGFVWTEDKPIAAQIEDFKPRVARLAALNAKYQAAAMYHTHSGPGLVGASICDLHEILRGADPKHVGVNYDIGHATIEGGLGGWIGSFRITGEHLRGIAVKDFAWEKDPAAKDGKPKWKAAWKPLGEGMVHFDQFFAMVRAAQFAGPFQLHFEYSLGGAESGKKTGLAMTKEEIFAKMKRDVTTLRGYLNTAKL
jgi:sugar phosphate isomerase/epimerase